MPVSLTTFFIYCSSILYDDILHYKANVLLLSSTSHLSKLNILDTYKAMHCIDICIRRVWQHKDVVVFCMHSHNDNKSGQRTSFIQTFKLKIPFPLFIYIRKYMNSILRNIPYKTCIKNILIIIKEAFIRSPRIWQ